MSEYHVEDKMKRLIATDPLLLMAMSRFGISLGFGEKQVGEICREQGVDSGTFLAVCNFITYGAENIDNVSVASLMQYLRNAHNYFLDFSLPLIRRRLIEAIDCSGLDEVAMLILKFYDENTTEVKNHMEHENQTVFVYVDNLLNNRATDLNYNIDVFAAGHHRIDTKLNELKDIIIRYLPQRENNLLNSVLYDIISCRQDLISHCAVENKLFVPAVKKLEEELALSGNTDEESGTTAEEHDTETAELGNREKEIIRCVAQGLSNKEIADKLNISFNTVTTHRRNIASKLQIHSTAALTIYAVINGLIEIPKNM